jgi:hypothetical protein
VLSALAGAVYPFKRYERSAHRSGKSIGLPLSEMAARFAQELMNTRTGTSGPFLTCSRADLRA